MTDAELLKEFVQTGSETAFQTMVERHAGMVRAACLRRLAGNSSDADEACQAVFVLLAQQARKIKRGDELAGWLHHAVAWVVSCQKRARQRRQNREKEAAAMHAADVLRAWAAGALAAQKGAGPAAEFTGLQAAAFLAKGAINMIFWAKVKTAVMVLLLLTVLGVGLPLGRHWAGAQDAKPEKPVAGNGSSVPTGKAVEYSAEADALRKRFAKHYKPIKVEVTPNAPQYSLPLDLAKLSNADTANQHLRNAELRGLFVKHGFAAEPPGTGDDVAKFYENLKMDGIPIFITSDSLLHLYHIQFGETLKDIEEREFFGDALALCKALYEASVKQATATTGVAQKAALLNAAYFAVALECLAHDRTREDLEQIRQETLKWDGQNEWEFTPKMEAKYPILRQQDLLSPQERQALERDLRRKSAKDGYLAILEALLKKFPSGKKEVEYVLGAGLPDADAKVLKEKVAAELALMEKHEGFADSPLFIYQEDYSQYVPRGHYTRSEKLKRYFKALMWLGRLTMVIKGGTPFGPIAPNLVDAETARIQTTAGVLAAELLDSTTVAGTNGTAGQARIGTNRNARELWERIYAVTAFYVGFADDLTPYEYRSAARKILGEKFAPATLNDEARYKALRLELAKMRGPAIYSGTGACEGPAIGASEADLLKALEKTKGFRLMGQRYIPDSYMLGKLVYPTVAPWGGGVPAFTSNGSSRIFPRGLDVMAVLGSVRAREVIKNLRDDNYPKQGDAKSYDEVLTELRKEFATIDEKGWNQNLYWSWLYCLKALLNEDSKGYPTFMQTTAWKDKQLSAALGSWSQLRHDTILYAKQSYTMGVTGMPEQPKMVEGYVEPVPEFYARLLALNRMTLNGLKEFKVLSPEVVTRLESLDKIIARLLDISQRELGGKFLAGEDYDFIRNFGWQLKSSVAGVNEEGLQTTIIADVHTDQNTKQVLEEGTGFLRRMWVAYPMPDGGVVVGAGPIFSYYEFKHPMSNRLTDEKWKELLRDKVKAPTLPEWTRTFGVEK
jgi:hypothetical protein